MYAARRNTNVANDPKKDDFVSLAMAFVAGAFERGGSVKVESGLKSLVSAVGRKGVDSVIFVNMYNGMRLVRVRMCEGKTPQEMDERMDRGKSEVKIEGTKKALEEFV
jgi:hypothetical protein